MNKTNPKYDQDLRFAPADESMSDEELQARADRLARATISGGAPRRERAPVQAEKERAPRSRLVRDLSNLPMRRAVGHYRI